MPNLMPQDVDKYTALFGKYDVADGLLQGTYVMAEAQDRGTDLWQAILLVKSSSARGFQPPFSFRSGALPTRRAAVHWFVPSSLWLCISSLVVRAAHCLLSRRFYPRACMTLLLADPQIAAARIEELPAG